MSLPLPVLLLSELLYILYRYMSSLLLLSLSLLWLLFLHPMYVLPCHLPLHIRTLSSDMSCRSSTLFRIRGHVAAPVSLPLPVLLLSGLLYILYRYMSFLLLLSLLLLWLLFLHPMYALPCHLPLHIHTLSSGMSCHSSTLLRIRGHVAAPVSLPLPVLLLSGLLYILYRYMSSLRFLSPLLLWLLFRHPMYVLPCHLPLHIHTFSSDVSCRSSRSHRNRVHVLL